VVFGAWGLSVWGVQVGSLLRQDALDFLQIRALGAPATLLLMVSQVLDLVPPLLPSRLDALPPRVQQFSGRVKMRKWWCDCHAGGVSGTGGH
jgi:hypothetical protein